MELERSSTRSVNGRSPALLPLALAVALLLSMPGATAPAAADEYVEAPDAAPYLALGDSLPYGWDPVTLPFPLVAPDFHVGYPEIYAGLVGLELTNASCPGETSGSFLDTGAADNGCAAVIDNLGIKVDWGSGSQLGYALGFLEANPDTALVTLQLGTNDLFL